MLAAKLRRRTPLVQHSPLVFLHPSLLHDGVIGVQLTRQLLQVLAGVIEVDNLNRTREVQISKIPDPFDAVG